MKYLLVLAVVLLVVWFVRNNRRSDNPRQSAPTQQPAAGQPQDMVQCPVCLVHLPRGDALPGASGQLYCCADHRVRAGS
jgi:uncharacterized protein